MLIYLVYVPTGSVRFICSAIVTYFAVSQPSTAAVFARGLS